MTRATASDENLAGARNRGAGEAATWREHRGEEVPRGSVEIESEDSGGRRGTVDRERASVEERTADDVEVGANGEGCEVAEAIDVGVTRHGGKGAPG